MPWTPTETERQRQIESGMTVVANLKEDKNLVSWAKKAGVLVRICRPTKWGNPFVIGRDGNRRQVLMQYSKYLRSKPVLLEQLETLRGKVLACWCHPEGCHGDELVRLIEAAHDNAAR